MPDTRKLIRRAELGRDVSQRELGHRYDDLHTHAVKLEATIKTIKMLRSRLKAALNNYRECFSQLAQSEDKRTLVEAELKEKTVVVDALMIELRSQRVELVRQYDEQAAKDAKNLADKTAEIARLKDALDAATGRCIGITEQAHRLHHRAIDAEALVGRIVIKRDKRGRRA